MAFVYVACTVHVTNFSTGGKFRPVSNFAELHALTLAARSYALLCAHMYILNDVYFLDTVVLLSSYFSLGE